MAETKTIGMLRAPGGEAYLNANDLVAVILERAKYAERAAVRNALIELATEISHGTRYSK